MLLHSFGTADRLLCPVRQPEPVALAAADHGFDRIGQKSTCNRTVAKFACPLQVFPSDLEGVFKQLESDIVMAGKRSGAAGVPVRRGQASLRMRITFSLTKYSGTMSQSGVFARRVEPNRFTKLLHSGKNQNGPGSETKNGARRILPADTWRTGSVRLHVSGRLPGPVQRSAACQPGSAVCRTWIHAAERLLLIAPSLYHQIVFDGESRPGALAYASWFAGASLLPLTLGLGASVFVVFEQLLAGRPGRFSASPSRPAPFCSCTGWDCPSTSLPEKEDAQSAATPLKIKIEQMLTEARVIIPGGQALLGFQFVCTFTRSFRVLRCRSSIFTLRLFAPSHFLSFC